VPRARNRGRGRLLLGVAVAAILAAAAAALPGTAKAATTICSNQTGTNGGHPELGQQLFHHVERHRRLRRRSRLESRQQFDEDLLQQPQRVWRYLAGVALRLVDQPAR
jgi:hypothetical protein